MAAKPKQKKKQVDKEGVYVIIALILFNLFFVLQFILGWMGVLIGFIFASFAFVVAGIFSFVVGIVASLMPAAELSRYLSLGGVSPLAMALLSISLACLGGLWMIGNYYLVKYSYKAVAWYVELNVKIFKKYGR